VLSPDSIPSRQSALLTPRGYSLEIQVLLRAPSWWVFFPSKTIPQYDGDHLEISAVIDQHDPAETRVPLRPASQVAFH
jgi:hypothetical protein